MRRLARPVRANSNAKGNSRSASTCQPQPASSALSPSPPLSNQKCFQISQFLVISYRVSRPASGWASVRPRHAVWIGLGSSELLLLHVGCGSWAAVRPGGAERPQYPQQRKYPEPSGTHTSCHFRTNAVQQRSLIRSPCPRARVASAEFQGQ